MWRRRLVSAVGFLLCASIVSGGGGPAFAEKLAGKLKRGTYSSPAKNFTVEVPRAEGMRVVDGYEEGSGAGAVSMSDDFNRLHGILYAPISAAFVEMPNDDSARVEALRDWFHEFAIPHWFVRVIPDTVVLREEGSVFEGMPVWKAVLELPKGAATGKFDLETGQVQPLDSTRGLVVFARGGYLYIVMCEIASLSEWGFEQAKYDPENWSAFTSDLGEFYRTITFRTSMER